MHPTAIEQTTERVMPNPPRQGLGRLLRHRGSTDVQVGRCGPPQQRGQASTSAGYVVGYSPRRPAWNGCAAAAAIQRSSMPWRCRTSRSATQLNRRRVLSPRRGCARRVRPEPPWRQRRLASAHVRGRPSARRRRTPRCLAPIDSLNSPPFRCRSLLPHYSLPDATLGLEGCIPCGTRSTGGRELRTSRSGALAGVFGV
jgi:hypothetical protein